MAEHINAVADALLKRQEVEHITGLGRSAIYARMNPEHPQYDPSFPIPVAVGSSAVRWVASEVNDWVAARIAKRDCGH